MQRAVLMYRSYLGFVSHVQRPCHPGPFLVVQGAFFASSSVADLLGQVMPRLHRDVREMGAMESHGDVGVKLKLRM